MFFVILLVKLLFWWNTWTYGTAYVTSNPTTAQYTYQVNIAFSDGVTCSVDEPSSRIPTSGAAKWRDGWFYRIYVIGNVSDACIRD